AAYTAAAPAGSCTYQNESTASPYAGPAVTCSYNMSATPATTTVTTCTPTQTTSTANSTVWSPTGYACGYAAYTAAAPAGSCTYQNQSTSAPYAGPAVTCSYATTSPTVTTVTSCTPVAYSTSTTNGAVWANNAQTCGYAAYSTAANAASCTYQNKSTTSPYAGPAVTCSFGTSPTVTSVSSCIPVAASGTTTNGSVWIPATTCGYSAYSAYANAASCTPLAQSTASPYTVGVATQCQTTDTGWVGALSCANSTSGGQTVYCWNPNPIVTGPTAVASCTAGTTSCVAPYTASSCITTSCTTNTIQASTAVGSCTQGNTGAPNYINTSCTTTTLSTTNNAPSCTPGIGGPPSYITTTCTVGSGGTSNTLADVAMYYYQTDLRDPSLSNCTGAPSTTYPSGTNVCPNNVFVTPEDNNTQQHLTTYTLGIGVRGAMVYTSPNYMSDTSGDFYSVKTGATANSSPTPPVCSWQANGTVCNWPIPASNSYTNVDDLWHAAVNGHGIYYSASNPSALSTGLTNALSSITARKGAAAAAATSTLNPVAGNNYAYVASYTTVQWTGNLEARSINTITGVIAQAATWCAENIPADTCLAPSVVVASTSGNSTVYNCVTPLSTASSCLSPGVFDSTANTCSLQMAVSCNGTLPPTVAPSSDTRTIYTANSTDTALINFDSIYATNDPVNFSAAHINTLTQWAGLTTSQQAVAGNPVNLINYLRGQTGYDNRASNPVANQLYRSRLAVMGDALESQPSYIAAPTFSYADTGYSAFVAANINRPGAVYMGTNDGMLHAFNGSTGAENWAYVPSIVIPNMYKLADFNYGTQHVNYVNGSPIISDFYCTVNCVGGVTPAWRTILVGGLNGGGREFYALDITNPTSPALLWEFTPAQDANLGYTYGLPVVTKMSNGTWVVLVTSGYDNGSLSGDGVTANSPAGNGLGYLYVLNAQTGAIINKISTGVGSAATPSGLAKIAAWNTASSSNQASYIYGGDLLGNLWRFDINAGAVFLMATLENSLGNAQPITTTPTLGQIDGERIVFVGTGEYLQTSDLSNTNVQSLYAISDTSTSTLYNPRSITKITGSTATGQMVQQTITASGSVRTGSSNPVDFNVDRGWYVDFPDTGERENVDSDLIQGTLLVPTIVPSNTVCAPGGYGWLNFFDYSSGSPVAAPLTPGGPPNTNVSVQYNASIVGMNILYIGGNPIVEVVTSNNPTPEVNTQVAIAPQTTNFSGTRVQWRELIP
ncbi:MAG: PilC/PilY family type IV pilus protein, partial [Gallionella sp.]